MASFSYNLITDITNQFAYERAKWIDETIQKNLTPWKLFVLKKFPSLFVAYLLNVDIEIKSEKLIDDIGTKVGIFINGKLVGVREFIINI